MKDIIKKSDAELSAELTTKRTALRDFRFALSGGKAKNMREGRGARKVIAQILTEVSARVKASKTVSTK